MDNYMLFMFQNILWDVENKKGEECGYIIHGTDHDYKQ